MKKEAEIEHELIERLVGLKYAYRDDIRDRETLESNFREKFESLNRVELTDGEFERLLDEIVTPDVFASAERLRNLEKFEREDGTPLYYQLVNLKDWCKNSFEVINQLRINTKSSHHRYDVIVLINGLPLVQIELKALQVSPRRAMQQIIDYRNDPGNGYGNSLLCFMQMFIVSNRSQTWYFSNNNNEHFQFNVEERFLPIYKWAKRDNSKVEHLSKFADQFLAKCTLAEMISRYMVLIQNERKLMIMRPYQVYAVRAIVDCIHENRGNGYIWHTTGSGKTLTSFKASTLLKDILHEPNPAKKIEFDAVVANPPFSYRWSPTEEMAKDFRFKNHGLAPKSAADLAFLLHGFHFLARDGAMAIILPHGVLFRGGTEKAIRTKLLKDGNIDTVIGLPPKLFYSTGIPVCILVLKKCKRTDDVLFINAAELYQPGKRQNSLLPEHIEKIVETYQHRTEKERFSRLVALEEIENEHDFNLNISRYVSTGEPEEDVDLDAVYEQLSGLGEQIGSAARRHNDYLKELGLPTLPLDRE